MPFINLFLQVHSGQAPSLGKSEQERLPQPVGMPQQQQPPFPQTSLHQPGPSYQQSSSSVAEQSAPPPVMSQASAPPVPVSQPIAMPQQVSDSHGSSSNIIREGTAAVPAQEGPSATLQETGVVQGGSSGTPQGVAPGIQEPALPAMQGIPPNAMQPGASGVMQGVTSGQGRGTPGVAQGGIPGAVPEGAPGDRRSGMPGTFQSGDESSNIPGVNAPQQQQALSQGQQHMGYPQMSTGPAAYTAPPMQATPTPSQTPGAPLSSTQTAMYTGVQQSSSAPMQAGPRIMPQQAQPPSGKVFPVSDSSQTAYPSSQFPQAPYQMSAQSYPGN